MWLVWRESTKSKPKWHSFWNLDHATPERVTNLCKNTTWIFKISDTLWLMSYDSDFKDQVPVQWPYFKVNVVMIIWAWHIRNWAEQVVFPWGRTPARCWCCSELCKQGRTSFISSFYYSNFKYKRCQNNKRWLHKQSFYFSSTMCKIEKVFEELFNFLMVICSGQK